MSEFTEGATTPDNTSATTDENQPSNEANDSKLENLVGEGKKFSDSEKLASAYQHADQRIEELKLEVDKLNSEKTGINEVLEEIRKQSPTTPPPTAPPGDANESITQEQLQELVTKQVNQLKGETDRKDKVKQTWRMMDEAFGDHEAASVAVSKYIDNDPSKEAIINSMAISDPVGLMKLIGKDVDKKSITFTDDSGGGEATPNLEDKLTWDMAQQIRKKNPKLYYSHAFRKRMLNEL